MTFQKNIPIGNLLRSLKTGDSLLLILLIMIYVQFRRTVAIVRHIHDIARNAYVQCRDFSWIFYKLLTSKKAQIHDTQMEHTATKTKKKICESFNSLAEKLAGEKRKAIMTPPARAVCIFVSKTRHDIYFSYSAPKFNEILTWYMCTVYIVCLLLKSLSPFFYSFSVFWSL